MQIEIPHGRGKGHWHRVVVDELGGEEAAARTPKGSKGVMYISPNAFTPSHARQSADEPQTDEEREAFEDGKQAARETFGNFGELLRASAPSTIERRTVIVGETIINKLRSGEDVDLLDSGITLIRASDLESEDKVKVAERICGLYFEIAEEVVGAEEVRRRFKLRFDRETFAPSATRESALEEAAIQALACMNPEPRGAASKVHFDPANNMARKIAGVIRSLKNSADGGNDCTEPDRARCPRLCQDFCNKAEEDKVRG